MPTALVTGSSTGIGEACVARLAQLGWTVFAGVRRDDDGARLIGQHPGDIRPVILDVSVREHTDRVLEQIAQHVGDRGLQGLVNNAGVGVGGPVEYLTDADWRFVFEVNFFGVVALSQAAIPLLRDGRGRIVHIGSIGGRIASPGLGPYSASKHALEALAEASRLEFSRSGTPIAVALVEPGAVKTAIWDKSAAEADAVERALDDTGRARYRWLIDSARGFIDAGRRHGVAPSKVADAVEHALTASRPKARYLVGPDAKLAGHVIARAPDRIRQFLMLLNVKRNEQAGRALANTYAE